MCEVTRKNFEELYPQIIDHLHSASFVSIDCEFSGLFDNDFKCSLFDTPKARFRKLQSVMEGYLIIQFGLSAFKYESKTNKFCVATYNFYLLPTSFFKTNSKFSCHMQSLEFLSSHRFNFNKLLYEGVSFLNKVDEAEALRRIEDGSLLSEDHLKVIQKYCSEVSEWNGGAENGSEMTLTLNNEREPFLYILHLEIRKRFPHIWTFLDKKNCIRIRKVDDSQKRKLLLNKEEDMTIKKELFDSILGFSRIIKELQNLKKPMVGHNCFIDMILIYKQFFNPFPVSYEKFKKNITEIFPDLYDTKHMSFRLKNILPKDGIWKSNNLYDLYEFLKQGKGATMVLFTPLTYHLDENYFKTSNFHEAGFDSFCTGFCFLKMAHILSLWDEKNKSFTVTTMRTTSSWLLSAVTPMKNKINISRARVNYIKTDGPDPKTEGLGFLFIASKTKEPLHIFKVTELIAKYSMIDFQPLSRYTGVMAVGNERIVREVLAFFQNHEKYTVSKYNFFKHSPLGRGIILVGVIAPMVLTGIFLSQRFYRN